MTSYFKTVNLKTFLSSPISLEVEQREKISFSGPSGIGKSLFFRAIADLDPHEGYSQINEFISSNTPPAQWRRLVSYVPKSS